MILRLGEKEEIAKELAIWKENGMKKKPQATSYSAVKHARYIGGADAGVLTVLVVGWADLLSEGWASERNVDTLNWDHQVLWITQDLVFRNGNVTPKVEGDGMNSISTVVAALTFSHMEHCKTTWINLAVVHPKNRRQGLYRRLYAEVKEHAKKAGMLRIQSSTSFDNMTMRRTAVETGRTLTSINYTEEL